MTRRNEILHRFNLTDAETYGLTEAIVLYNLRFWIKKNKARGTNLYNGTTWTYNSYKKFSKVFPYLSESQIKRALTSLLKQGAIVKGNFNKKRYDRTKWYALVDESQSLTAGRNCSDEAIHYNGRVQSFEGPMPSLSTDDCVPPIPDTKTQILKHS